jgi:ubiquinone/menaquinone biosynthesis C-methylase UbiE
MGLFKFWETSTDLKVIDKYLPDESSRQTHAFAEAIRVIRKMNASGINNLKLVDLGCGDGNSYYKFRKANASIDWLGVDIEESPEVNRRTDKNLKVVNFDGVNIPLEDNSVDFIYSHQVFEHVRYPQALIKEIHRVLRPNGKFVGSTSQVEPFHSRSFWNYTPYGFATLLEEAQFKNIYFKPGLDGISLVCHSLLGYLKLNRLTRFMFEYQTPLNFFIGFCGRILGAPAKYRAGLKLIISGHIIFHSEK